MVISGIPRGAAFEPFFAAHCEEDEDGHLRVVLSGELDMAMVGDLEQAVERAERGGGTVVALDLTGLSFMDVAGLRCIRSIAEQAQAESRELAVVGACSAVRRVFELTGLAGLLDPTSPRAVSANGDGRG